MSLGHLPRLLRTASFGLALLYAALLAASFVIVGALVYWTVEASLEKQMAVRIDGEIELLTDEMRSEGVPELVEQIGRRESVLNLEYLLLDASGSRAASEMPVTPTMLGWSDIALPAESTGVSGARVLHIRSVELDNGMRLSVADDYGSIEDMRHAWLEAGVWSLIAFLALSVFGGLLLSRGFLRRVDMIRTTAQAIISGDLETRIPLSGTNDNFDLLSRTLNQMLDRIQVLMDGVRQVSNDIAHALRTPLGRLHQGLETARTIAEGNPSFEHVIDRAQLETEAILKTFSALLRIARIEVVARHSGFREVDLSALSKTVVEAYSVAAEEQGKTITAKIAPSIQIRGDKELLAEMFANLLDNGIRHTPAGSCIEVSLHQAGSKIIVSIADNGLGVPAEERERIFQRFYRLDRSSEIDGTGLGLSLVAAVSGLHGWQLSVTDNAPGLRIEMSLDTNPQDSLSTTEPQRAPSPHTRRGKLAVGR